MKSALFTLGTILTTIWVSAQDFKTVSWGMTMEQVIEAEEIKTYSKAPDSINYKTEMAGLPAVLVYIFDEGELVKAKYKFNLEYLDPNDYIRDYEMLKGKLVDKYGQPYDTEVSWQNDRYKEDRMKWGTALNNGNVVFYDRWKGDFNKVDLGMLGDGSRVYLHIHYYDVEYARIMEEKEAEKRTKDL
jgi:hypothetical protein